MKIKSILIGTLFILLLTISNISIAGYVLIDSDNFGGTITVLGENPPDITINFAGNLSDLGGPYYKPPFESGNENELGDGYYTNNSRQHEDWMFINVTASAEGIETITNVWLQWLNKSDTYIWTNFTYAFENVNGDYWHYNTSGNITTSPLYNYSFNIHANSSGGKSNIVYWNKTGMNGLTRRYVKLNQTPTLNLSTIPLYLYECELEDGSDDLLKPDRLIRDQGTDGSYTDVGYMENRTPTDDLQIRNCGSFVVNYMNLDECIIETTIDTMYYHAWWSVNQSKADWMHFGQRSTRGTPTSSTVYDLVNETIADSVSNRTFDEYNVNWTDIFLSTGLIQDIDEKVTDNNIFEFQFKLTDGVTLESNQPLIVSNRSLNTFIIPNLPSNDTLNNTGLQGGGNDTDNDGIIDYDELWTYYTNPFLSDTDNDGVSDYDESLNGTDPNNYTDTPVFDLNQTVVFSNPNPSDTETSVSISQATWNITINDPDGDTFNWTIEVSNGDSNSSNDDTNGSKIVDLTTPLDYSTVYTIWVNATDNGTDQTIRDTFTFTTIAPAPASYTLIDTASFGGRINVQSEGGSGETSYVLIDTASFGGLAKNYPLITNYYPLNASRDVDMYPLLYITVESENTFDINWSTNYSSWTVENNSCSSGTYYQRATFVNLSDSDFYWTVKINDTENNWFNATYHFTTRSYSYTNWSDIWNFNHSSSLTFENINPSNKSTNQPLDLTWSLIINHSDGNTFNWSIEASNGVNNSGNNDNNGTKNLILSNLNHNTNYTIWVNATDGSLNKSSVFWFITKSNNHPIISNEQPTNNTNIPRTTTSITVDINDLDGDTFNWTIEVSNGNSSSGNSASNGTKTCNVVLDYGTNYTWWVNVTDGFNWTKTWYEFSTDTNNLPIISNEQPTNNTQVSHTTNTLSIYISDLEGSLMDWSITLNDGTSNSNVNSNNGTKTCNVVLDYGTNYTWWVNVTDGYGWTREWYEFSTNPNQKVEINNPSPTNNSLGNNITDTTQFSINLSDIEGDLFNWTIQVDNGDISSGNSASNGTKTCSLTTPLNYNTQYKIWVNVTDFSGSGLWNITWYVFHTETVGGTAPSIVLNTTTGIEETNVTGNAYVTGSALPAQGWFRYGKTLSSLSSTTPQAVGLGSFSQNVTPLTPGSYYYLQAQSSNAYGTNSTNYTNFLTKPNAPTNFAINSFNDSLINLTWIKGTGANNTIIERNSSANWDLGEGTQVYNGTNNSYSDSVSPATTYYYQAWSYASYNSFYRFSDDNISLNGSTYPEPPQNITYILGILGNGTANLTILWDNGNGADTTLIRKGTITSPDEVTEGTQVYNSTSNTTTDPFISVPYLYTLWSYNTTTGLYSIPVYLGWYASWINVFNESNPSQAVQNWNVEISNPEGSDVYLSTSNNNPLIINISDMPTGLNIGFSFSAENYKNRIYKKDISETGAISFNAYLPPDFVNTGGGGGGGIPGGSELSYHIETGNISDYTTDETINLDYNIYEIDVVEKYERISYDRFLHADSQTVSSSTVDLDITLNFTCDEIYNVLAYENLNAEDVYTDSSTVTNPDVDKNITFTHTPVGQILGVYKYNVSIYGGWIWVSSDNYSYDSSNLTVNASVMDENTSMIKVDYVLEGTGQGVVERPIPHDKVKITGYTATVNKTALNSNTTLVRIEYYTYINEYYNWIFIPKQKYTNTSNSVTINQTELTENTLLVRVKYYSYEHSNYIEPNLYILQVVDPSGSTVYNAKVIVKRYINTTGKYEEVGSYITDGNGQIEIFLIPFVNYKVTINASDKGYAVNTYDYTPSDSVFLHVFRLSIAEVDPSEGNMFSGITWSIEPNNHYQNGNFTIYFNITSTDNELDWFTASFYFYNTTTTTWVLLYIENITTQAGGGSISYTIEDVNVSNISGKYKIEAWYKKQDYNAYEVTQTGSTIFFLQDGGIVSSPVWSLIPDWVFLLIVLIIMALVMAVLLPVAGIGTGYIGIGIMAISLILKPDLIMTDGISGWAILTITAIMYTIALFIWSRI